MKNSKKKPDKTSSNALILICTNKNW